ncbi:MAG TPA: trigger factor [Trueperaceae bacterium]
MRTELVDKKAVEATVKVTVPAADVDAAYEQVISELARQVRIPGFRQGRVPRGVLVKRIGPEALNEEVKEKLIDAHFQAALKEHEILPISTHFHAHEPIQGADYTFEIHSELYPDVTLPDLSAFTLSAEKRELTDELVSEAVEELQRENATLVPVDRPVQPTDWVMIEATSLSPAPAEDGRPEDAESSDPAPEPQTSTFPVDLERAAEELRDQLTGAALGEEREITLTDEVDRDEDGAARVRRMRVKVVDVKEKDKPEPGEDFATQLGMDSWDAVLERVRSAIADDLAREVYEARRAELIDKLTSEAQLELPPGLVRRRQQTLLENLVEDLQRQGESFQGYLSRLEARGKREEFETELLETAEKGVRRDLVLERLMEVRGTELSDAELTDALKHLAAQRRQDVGSFVRDMGENWVTNYRFMLTRDKAVRDFIAELTGEAASPADEDSLMEAAEASIEAEEEQHAEDHEHHHHGDGHDHHHHHDEKDGHEH